MNKIKVKLLNITPESIVNQAVAMPYGSEPSFELTKRVICMKKHLSCAEHIVMNFLIEGSSRLELQEHMRHRMASPTVKSSRFTLNKDLSKYADKDDYSDLFVMPDLSALSSEQQELMKSAYDAVYPRVMTALTILKESNIPNDYVKYILPESFRTSFSWTINLRSLLNFLHLRTDKNAHFEIRHISNLILQELANNEQSRYVANLIIEYVKGINK